MKSSNVSSLSSINPPAPHYCHYPRYFGSLSPSFALKTALFTKAALKSSNVSSISYISTNICTRNSFNSKITSLRGQQDLQTSIIPIQRSLNPPTPFQPSQTHRPTVPA